MVAPSRRRRRPRWLFFGLALSALVLAVNAAISARSPAPARRLAQLAYLDRVRPLITRSSDEGAQVADVRNRAGSLGRAGIISHLDGVVRDSQAVEAALGNTWAPKTLRNAHDLLVATMAIRAQAATALHDAMVSALGPGPVSPTTAALGDAGQDMIAADRAYQLFLAGIPPDVRSEGALPNSQWVPDPGAWASAPVTVFVAALRSSQSLAPVHDVAIVEAQTQPPAVGSDNGAQIVPMTRALKVMAVVANTGNGPERHLTVTATLTGPGNSVESVRDFADLAAGESQAITLGDLHPIQGATETLTVQVKAVDGETNLADNQQTLTLEFK